MAFLFNLFISYGCWGMLIAAFLAGSVLPFSSEAVMVGLQAIGTPAAELLVWGSIGNIMGSMFNFYVGRMGRLEWIEKYLHIKKEKMEKAQQYVQKYGAWIGFFAFIPILGSAITVSLGLMRANPLFTLLTVSIGKIVRYAILIYSVSYITT